MQEPIIEPKNREEAIAVFRAAVVGPLLYRQLDRGERTRLYWEISQQRHRPPGSAISRTYSVATLQRWVKRFSEGGAQALQNKPRSDRGHAQALGVDIRKLLLDIRAEHPRASVPVILQTMAASGGLAGIELSRSQLRRFYHEHGMTRSTGRSATRPRERRKWEAAYVGALWHADVCHLSDATINGKKTPVRVHAILDDVSRYVVALRVCSTEKEWDMIDMLVGAIRTHGCPATLYVDNGSTYRGNTLKTICTRLGIGHVHARPYDPQARGKMERFWRTYREQCAEWMNSNMSIHDLQARSLAYLSQGYHVSSHAGLRGDTPTRQWAKRRLRPVTEADLRTAMTFRESRRVRGDSTLTVAGVEWEMPLSHLNGKTVDVVRTLADRRRAPWVEHGDQRFELKLVDPAANGRTGRKPVSASTKASIDGVAFDPPGALLNQLIGRRGPRE